MMLLAAAAVHCVCSTKHSVANARSILFVKDMRSFVSCVYINRRIYYIRFSGSIGYHTAEGADRLNDLLLNQIIMLMCVHIARV